MHFIREIPEGIEFRTRFWMGYHILDRKPYYCLPKTARIPEIVAKGLAMVGPPALPVLVAMLKKGGDNEDDPGRVVATVVLKLMGATVAQSGARRLWIAPSA